MAKFAERFHAMAAGDEHISAVAFANRDAVLQPHRGNRFAKALTVVGSTARLPPGISI
jgi:hypothetical protein